MTERARIPEMPGRQKTHDYEYAFRGTWDKEPEGRCRVRILHEDVLPVLERQGGRDLFFALANLGSCLIQRGGAEDLAEARSHLERAAGMAQSMRLPFPEPLLQWLASSAGRTPP